MWRVWCCCSKNMKYGIHLLNGLYCKVKWNNSSCWQLAVAFTRYVLGLLPVVKWTSDEKYSRYQSKCYRFYPKKGIFFLSAKLNAIAPTHTGAFPRDFYRQHRIKWICMYYIYIAEKRSNSEKHTPICTVIRNVIILLKTQWAFRAEKKRMFIPFKKFDELAPHVKFPMFIWLVRIWMHIRPYSEWKYIDSFESIVTFLTTNIYLQKD